MRSSVSGQRVMTDTAAAKRQPPVGVSALVSAREIGNPDQSVRDVDIKIGVRAVPRRLARIDSGQDPVHPEGPSALTRPTPRQQVPMGAGPGERHWLNLAHGHDIAPVTVVEQQDMAGGDRLLDRQRDHRPGCRRAGFAAASCAGGAPPAAPGLPPGRGPLRAGSPVPIRRIRSINCAASSKSRGRGSGQHLAQRAPGPRRRTASFRPGQRHRYRDHLSRGEIDRREGARLVDHIAAAPPGSGRRSAHLHSCSARMSRSIVRVLTSYFPVSSRADRCRGATARNSSTRA